MRSGSLLQVLLLPMLAGGLVGRPAAQSGGSARSPVLESRSALESLSTRIGRLLAEHDVVGASVGLVDRDGMLWSEAYGFLDRETAAPVTVDSRFRAGSISKSVVGLLVMQLVAEGRLELSMPLAEVAPEVGFENRWEDDEPVRIVHLLEHTTGWDGIHFAEFRGGIREPDSIESFDPPRSRTSRWPPGRYGSYCNGGYAVLTQVLEKVSGEDLDSLARGRVFGPLGMTTATFAQSDAVIRTVSRSYTWNGGALPFRRLAATGSGALSISLRDLGRLTRSFLRRGELDGVRILPEAAIGRIETPGSSLAAEAGMTLGYGLGMKVIRSPGDGIYRGHDGMVDGFLASFGYRSDVGVGYVSMLNTANTFASAAVQAALTDYLDAEHGPTDPGATPRPGVGGAAAEAVPRVSGWFRPFTPRNEWTRLLDDLTEVVHLRSTDDALYVSRGFLGEELRYEHLGRGEFARAGRRAPAYGLCPGLDGEWELFAGFQSTYRPASSAAVWAVPAVFVCLALAILSLIVVELTLAIRRVRVPGRSRVWLLPKLALLSFGAAGGALLWAVSTDLYAELSGPNLLTRAFQWGTLAMPVFAGLGLLAAALMRNAPRGARVHAGCVAASLLILAGLLWNYGWLGMTFWDYAVPVAVR